MAKKRKETAKEPSKIATDKKTGHIKAAPGYAMSMTPKAGTGAGRKDKEYKTGAGTVKVKNAPNGAYIPKPTGPGKPVAAAPKVRSVANKGNKAFKHVKKAGAKQRRGGLRKC